MPQCKFLFSAVFVFQKSCMGNILGIAREKNPRTLRREPEACRGCQISPRRGQPWARAWAWSGPPRAPPTPPFRLFIPCIGKTIETKKKTHEEFRSRRHRRTHLGRVLQLFLAPCWRENPSP